MSQPSIERKRRITHAVEVCMDRGIISERVKGKRNGAQQRLADHFGVTRQWICLIVREVRLDRSHR